MRTSLAAFGSLALAVLAAPAAHAASSPDAGCAPPLLAERPSGPRSGMVPAFINVEVDYMVERNPDGSVRHSHRPTQAEVNAVVQMFACQGIVLVIDVDDEIPHAEVLQRDPDDSSNFFDYDDDIFPEFAFGSIKEAHADHDPFTGWHYAVFGHQYENSDYETTGSSGLGEIGGDDFIVTLGDFAGEVGTPWDRAATLAHELGHNLGLRHYGGMGSAVGNYAPNVTSIMSYYHQLTGVRTALRCHGLISGEDDETGFKQLDYSHGRACTLTEYALDEARGMGVVAVDWDCDGSVGGVQSVRIGNQRDGWCGAGAGSYILTDYNEWANIEDNTSFAPPAGEPPPTVECVTSEEIAAYRAALDAVVARNAARLAVTEPDPSAPTAPLAPLTPLDHCPQATLAVEACERRGMRYVATNGTPNASGLSCRSPVLGPALGVSAASAGDVLYLGAGTYSGALTITKQVKLLGPGGAVLGGQ